MTRKRSSGTNASDEELNEALAALISSTKSKARPYALTDVATWLKIARKKLGSYSAVASRIGISAKMLRQFSYVHRLSHPVQELYASRKLDSVDALAHLAMLSPADQNSVARALAAKDLNTSDVRALVELRAKLPKTSIASLIDRVKSTRPSKEYVVEFVIRGTVDEKRISTAIHRYVPKEEVLRLEIDGLIGRLVLTPKGRSALAAAARRIGTSLGTVMTKIL